MALSTSQIRVQRLWAHRDKSASNTNDAHTSSGRMLITWPQMALFFLQVKKCVAFEHEHEHYVLTSWYLDAKPDANNKKLIVPKHLLSELEISS